MWLDKSILTYTVSVLLYILLLIYIIAKKNEFKKIFYITLLYFYGVVVFHVTLLPIPLDSIGIESLQMMSENNVYIQLIPFLDIFTYGLYSFIKQIVGNIVMFIPLGVLLPLIYDRCKSFKYIIKYSFITSLLIESLQLIICFILIKAPFRIFDINDLLLNTLGGIIGYIFYINIKQVIKKEVSC